MSEIFSFEQPHLGRVQDNRSSLMVFQSEEGSPLGKKGCSYGNEVREELEDFLFPGRGGFYVDSISKDIIPALNDPQEPQEKFLQSQFQDGTSVRSFSPTFPSRHEEMSRVARVPSQRSLLDLSKENPCAHQFFSHGTFNSRVNDEKIEGPKMESRKLPTKDILCLAGAKLLQSSALGIGDFFKLSHLFGNKFLTISDAEFKDVELLHYLLDSADKVGKQQYDRARSILRQCDYLSSDTGNSVQRIVYHFSKALWEKIDGETGTTTDGREEKQLFDLNRATLSLNPALVAFHQEVPFSQVCQFTAMQAITDHVGEAKRIHIIDLQIRSGIQYTALMQALASRSSCALEVLKITAVGIQSETIMEETGKRLMVFAQSMNIPFSFNTVLVPHMRDLKKSLFNIESGDVVAVYAPYSLRVLLPWPDQLESLMRILKDINPCIMALIEVEANHNSPVFVNRFIESLFYYAAFFDCLENCMDHSNPYRRISEEICFSTAIRNIVAAEKEERIIRNVKISVWRTFFARFGMVESELSASSLYQARVVAKNFTGGNFCTFSMDGKCLTVGWKETPIFSVSAWKFM